MVKNSKKSLSRKYLKIIGIVTLVLGIIYVALAIAGMFVLNNMDLAQVLSADQLQELRDANITDQMIRIFICVGGMVAALVSVLEGILLMRASNDPRKSVFLLVLIVLSIISGIYTLVSGGIQNIGANFGSIIGLTVNVLAIMAVMSARKEIE